jgi:hypothetical protein
MVNRGWLKRLVQAGKVEARCDYHLTDDYAFDVGRDPGRIRWMPARFSTGYGDFVEGQMNLRDLDFSGPVGRAWLSDDGTITLDVHSNCCYSLRVCSSEAGYS